MAEVGAVPSRRKQKLRNAARRFLATALPFCYDRGESRIVVHHVQRGRCAEEFL
jgi:hypothetical protein